MSDTDRRQEPTGARIARARPDRVLTIEGETVARFSHQLRSLLTSVGAAAEYLLTNETERGVRDEMLGIISEQATRIDGLLDDFLVVASSDSGSAAAAATVNLYQVARQAVRDLAGEAQSAGTWLVLDAAGAVSPVRGHHQALRQAVVGSLRAMISLARPGERIVAGLEEARSEDGEKLIQCSVLIQSDDSGLDNRADCLSVVDLSLEAARRICESQGGSFEMLEGRPGLALRLPVAQMDLSASAAARMERTVTIGGA